MTLNTIPQYWATQKGQEDMAGMRTMLTAKAEFASSIEAPGNSVGGLKHKAPGLT